MSGLAYDAPENNSGTFDPTPVGESSPDVHTNRGVSHHNGQQHWTPGNLAGSVDDFYQPPRMSLDLHYASLSTSLCL